MFSPPFASSLRRPAMPIDIAYEGALPVQAALALAELDPARVGAPIAAERLFDCVNVILSYQNGDGGWATYENTRSYSALEVRSLPQLCSACTAPRAITCLLRHTGRDRMQGARRPQLHAWGHTSSIPEALPAVCALYANSIRGIVY